MFKKLLLITFLVSSSFTVFNGYYQTTRIEIDNINDTCYGTLLSKTSEVGSFSYKIEIDLDVDENIINAFKTYEDKDNFFYLNYLQDVSEGLLFWPYFPPENFKVLLYFPNTNTFVTTDTIYNTYCLTNDFKASINNGVLYLTQSYNYSKLIYLTVIITIIASVISILIAFITGRPSEAEYKYVILSNLLFHIIVNIGIAMHSFRVGFSIVEYYLVLWAPYLFFFFIQGYLYLKKTHVLKSPFLCSFYTNVLTYLIGLLIVDVFPKLFTIAY